jgi:hypothetical protein
MPDLPEEAVEAAIDAAVNPLKSKLPADWVDVRTRDDIRRQLLPALQAAASIIRKQERERVREALEATLQVLDLEIARCQELADVWAYEGVVEEPGAVIRGQRDKLKELRADLAALDTVEDSDV